MTTNVFDGDAGMMATDSRWSVSWGNYVVYVDNAGFEKIERLPDHVLMFAGKGERIQEWKTWLRSNPPSPAGKPGHDGMCVCMVRIADRTPVFCAGERIDRLGAIFAGTGSFAALQCWFVNRDAQRAVETAKSADIYSGGEVKYFDTAARDHNLFPGADVTFADLVRVMNDRGLVMTIGNAKTTPDIPFRLKDAAASNDELREIADKIAGGVLKPCAPCDGMYHTWTDKEKNDFDAALGEAFGWNR